MNIEKLQKVVSMRAFIPEYVDSTVIKYDSSTRHKMRGIDGNGKPISFSPEEKLAIRNGLKKFLKEIGYSK